MDDEDHKADRQVEKKQAQMRRLLQIAEETEAAESDQNPQEVIDKLKGLSVSISEFADKVIFS